MRSDTMHNDPAAEPEVDEQQRYDSDATMMDGDRPAVVDGEVTDSDREVGTDAGWNDPDRLDADATEYGSATSEPTEYGSATSEPVAATAPVAGATDPTGPQSASYATPADRDGDVAGSTWPADTVTDLQERWREIQLQFVDDPRHAAGEAQDLLDRALSEYSRVMAARKSELDGWRNNGDGGESDTEEMRMVLRRYRDMLDQLLAR